MNNVTHMSSMFEAAESFNQDLSSWDVSRVNTMKRMFFSASTFNQDLSSWDVSNVYDMSYMFYEASSFNGDISSWDVINVIDIEGMFDNASAFNQDIGSWDLSSLTTMGDMKNTEYYEKGNKMRVLDKNLEVGVKELFAEGEESFYDNKGNYYEFDEELDLYVDEGLDAVDIVVAMNMGMI